MLVLKFLKYLIFGQLYKVQGSKSLKVLKIRTEYYQKKIGKMLNYSRISYIDIFSGESGHKLEQHIPCTMGSLKRRRQNATCRFSGYRYKKKIFYTRGTLRGIT